jgi:farnesyl-diphosphate farnesyltransferase
VLDPALDPILAKTSRSFALTLKLLPRATRSAVALAYLFARAADTIADTRIVPTDERRRLLAELGGLIRADRSGDGVGRRSEVLGEIRSRLEGPAEVEEERALLEGLGRAFEIWDREPDLERRLTARLLATIVSGQDSDLARFPDEADESPRGASGAAGFASRKVRALETREELFEYCYRVAGCVGEFWTELHGARLPRLSGWDVPAQVERARLFGRALQLTNVLRDVARDLRHGRCYLPRRELEAAGLAPRDLLDPGSWERARPVYLDLVAHADACCRAGFRYTLAIPRSEPFLRLATALPLLIALPTLGRLQKSNPLNPASKLKISRKQVFTLLGQAIVAIPSDFSLKRLFRRTARDAKRQKKLSLS